MNDIDIPVKAFDDAEDPDGVGWVAREAATQARYRRQHALDLAVEVAKIDGMVFAGEVIGGITEMAQAFHEFLES